jgi:hypothetical protein
LTAAAAGRNPPFKKVEPNGVALWSQIIYTIFFIMEQQQAAIPPFKKVQRDWRCGAKL